MYIPVYSYEEIKNYDFTATWKIDDQDWVKKRRATWSQIQDSVIFFCSPMRNKKSMKLIREYYLTGQISSEKLLFSMIDPDDYSFRMPFDFENSESHMLLQFWLSPDHSEENFLRIRDSHYYYYLFNNNNFKEPHKNIEWVMNQFCRGYHASCWKVRGVCSYFTIEKQDKGPFFGGIEEKLLSYFKVLDPSCTKDWKVDENYSCSEKWALKQRKDDWSRLFSRLTDSLIGFLGGGGQVGNVFNPNNHIRFLIDDYIKWAFLYNSKYINISFQLSSMVAILKNVLITPQGRHPIQMEVAKKLEQGLLVDQIGFSYEAKLAIAMGVEVFNEDKWIVGYKTRPTQYKLNYRCWPDGPGVRWVNKFKKEYTARNQTGEV